MYQTRAVHTTDSGRWPCAYKQSKQQAAFAYAEPTGY